MKNKVIGFFFLEHMVTGDTFLAMMENTNLHHVLVRTVFQLHGAPRYVSHYVHTLRDREFPDCWIGRGGPVPCPLVLQI
jgi:hypothetical protein